MITITISGKEKSGKTIIGNLIKDGLERCGVEHRIRNFEEKWLTAEEVKMMLLGEEVELLELTERDDRGCE